MRQEDLRRVTEDTNRHSEENDVSTHGAEANTLSMAGQIRVSYPGPMPFLIWLRDNGTSTWIRESESVWAYPTVLFLHTFGMSMLVGLISAIDLRVLGVGRQLPLRPFSRLLPLVWIGFWINLVTGTVLFAIDAPAKFVNPAFPIKLALIAAGMVLIKVTQRDVSRDEPDTSVLDTRARVLAGLSLVVWAGAVTAGRLMAYVGTRG